jgi:hypothetical protein
MLETKMELRASVSDFPPTREVLLYRRGGVVPPTTYLPATKQRLFERALW